MPTPSPAIDITPQPSKSPTRKSRSIPSPSVFPQPGLIQETPTPLKTLVPEIILLSPLEGISIDQLPGLVSNPFAPPPPGFDDPHHGVDLSILDQNTGFAAGGSPVGSILGGIVAAQVHDRFPYGNAILIETRFDSQSPHSVQDIPIPTMTTMLEPPHALTCPSIGDGGQSTLLPSLDDSERSFYILYAHLDEPIQFQIGERVMPGQRLGEVGMTGNALNPHLHLELRIGPSNTQIPSMSHYSSNATNEEMWHYCLWRVSGLFQPIDPMFLFELLLEPSP